MLFKLRSFSKVWYQNHNEIININDGNMCFIYNLYTFFFFLDDI